MAWSVGWTLSSGDRPPSLPPYVIFIIYIRWGYSTPSCILCGGCSQPVGMGQFDPRPDHWAWTRPDTWQPCHVWPTRKSERSSSVTLPPLLQHHAATVATEQETPTWSNGPLRCNSRPHLVHRNFNVRRWHRVTGHHDGTPTPTWATATSIGGAPPSISTGGDVSSDYNRRWTQLRFQPTMSEFWFQPTMAQDLITISDGSAWIPTGGGLGSDFNLKIPIRTVAYVASITMF
jgi:hypothetical protein